MGEQIKVLDHGYIQLIESWGSDERIIESARMSTGKGFNGWGPRCVECANAGLGSTIVMESAVGPSMAPAKLRCSHCGSFNVVSGDEKLLRYLWENKHCYDAETEVLTKRGFVRWSELLGDDALGQWDAATDSLVYERPFELIRRSHKGRMYRVDHGGVDLLVTENHKMLVKRIVSVPGANRQEWGSIWTLVTASDLDHASMVRYRKHAARKGVADVDLSEQFPVHNDSRALLRLIGFFIGDGHAGGTRANGLDFHLRKPRKITFLKEVCLELGWQLAELPHDTYVVRAENVTQIFQECFYDTNGAKRIPKRFLDLNAGDAAAVLDGLKASDGAVKRGAWEYFSTSKQVAEAVQLLVLHAGGAAHIHSDGYMNRVMVLSRMTEPVINQGKRNTDWVDYDGEVFCAHTRTGVLVVRRNGKIVLSGNSTPFEMAGAIIEVQAPIFVFREWHRHRTQSYNEMSARYAPLPDVNYVPSFHRVMMNADGTNKQAGTVAGAAVLTDIPAQRWREKLEDVYKAQEALYQEGLSIGIPKELARLVLPVGRYSRMRASSNLRGWMNFLTLRQASNAQWEIRQYAGALNGILKPLFPRTMELFNGAI